MEHYDEADFISDIASPESVKEEMGVHRIQTLLFVFSMAAALCLYGRLSASSVRWTTLKDAATTIANYFEVSFNQRHFPLLCRFEADSTMVDFVFVCSRFGFWFVADLDSQFTSM